MDIDLYYINKDDELVLVDYKTDYIERGKENELIEKYKVEIKNYEMSASNNSEIEKLKSNLADKCHITGSRIMTRVIEKYCESER